MNGSGAGRSPFSLTPAPPLPHRRMPSLSENTKPTQKFEYTFNGGEPFAYVFLLQLINGERKEYVAGVAEFKAVEDSGGTWEFVARDNIRYVRSPNVAMSRPADQTMMLRRTMRVSDSGREPDVDENLPALLGNMGDWFFPPIPLRHRSAIEGLCRRLEPVHRRVEEFRSVRQGRPQRDCMVRVVR